MAGLPPLVDAATLAAHLEDPDLRVFDATVRLLRPPGGGPYTPESGRDTYEREHIPGAAFADIPGELSDPGAPLPFTLPSAERFAAGAARLGIGPGSHVVLYAQETPMWATRLWWLLRFFGFDAVSVLDGGLAAWRAAGLPLQSGSRQYEPAAFSAVPHPELLASKTDVEAHVADGGACLVNALSPEVFRGEGVSSYSRLGRIPGSVNAHHASFLDPDTGRFWPPAALVATLKRAGVLTRTDAMPPSGATPGEPLIAYCGAGISATVPLFALFLVGRADARLYDGSLAEWTSDPSAAVELG